MEEIERTSRAALRPLFEGFVGLNGMIDAILEGSMGDAFADDRHAPRIARLALDDFHAVAGDPGRRGASEALFSIPAGDHVAVGAGWRTRLEQTRDAEPYDRFAFSCPERWDPGDLAALREGLAEGFELLRVGVDDVAAFEGLAESLVCNFDSHEEFLEKGVGFAVKNEDGEIVAGCSSYAISSSRLEFEIQTRPDYQRRGLALATGATMIEHCMDEGLEPCWDAAHVGSALLAERLGFVGRRRYTAYRMK